MLIFIQKNVISKKNVAIILYKIIDDLFYFDNDKQNL